MAIDLNLSLMINRLLYLHLSQLMVVLMLLLLAQYKLLMVTYKNWCLSWSLIQSWVLMCVNNQKLLNNPWVLCQKVYRWLWSRLVAYSYNLDHHFLEWDIHKIFHLVVVDMSMKNYRHHQYMFHHLCNAMVPIGTRHIDIHTFHHDNRVHNNTQAVLLPLSTVHCFHMVNLHTRVLFLHNYSL